MYQGKFDVGREGRRRRRRKKKKKMKKKRLRGGWRSVVAHRAERRTIVGIGRVEGVRRAAGPRVPLILTGIR